MLWSLTCKVNLPREPRDFQFQTFAFNLSLSCSLRDKDPNAKGNAPSTWWAFFYPKLSCILRIPRMKLVWLWTWRVTSLGHHTGSTAFIGLARTGGAFPGSAWLASPTKTRKRMVKEWSNAACLRTKWSCGNHTHKIPERNIDGA